MSVQSNYNEQPYAQVGVINAVEPYVMESVAAPAGGLGFGLAIDRDGSANAGGEVFAIVAQHQSVEQTYPIYTDATGFIEGAPAAALRSGAIWVRIIAGAVPAPGDAIAVDGSGAFGASGETGFVDCTNVVVEDAKALGMYVSENDLVLVRIVI